MSETALMKRCRRRSAGGRALAGPCVIYHTRNGRIIISGARVLGRYTSCYPRVSDEDVVLSLKTARCGYRYEAILLYGLRVVVCTALSCRCR